MTDHQPLTTQQLDEIAARAGHLYEYVQQPEEADVLAGTDVPALLADNQRLRQQVAEMTRCRDNALRALHRDDVETDIDLAETIAAPFYGPGWDWDEPDLKRVANVAADAVRPAFGKLTQQRDFLLRRLAAKDARTGDGDRALTELLGADDARSAAPAAPDTLPAWLARRFDPRGVDWDDLTDDDRAYWEHQTRAVRRAVARGGFKPAAARPAATTQDGAQ